MAKSRTLLPDYSERSNKKRTDRDNENVVAAASLPAEFA